MVNVDQKLNFSGPVTSVNQNVTGANVGVGFVFQPANWQIAGIPVAVLGLWHLGTVTAPRSVATPGTTRILERIQCRCACRRDKRRYPHSQSLRFGLAAK